MKEPNRTCMVCGKRFYAKPSADRTTCSKECQYVYFKGNKTLLIGAGKGANNQRYNDGKTINDGYTLVRRIGHPHANSKGYIREHRVVMEEHIGRLLTDEEEVHHRNRDRSDNNILNLMLFKNHEEHIAWHREHPEPEPYLSEPWHPAMNL